ncbi:hypothetical protein N499_0300B, partial [Wolbachia pipientis wVitA]
GLLSFQSGIQKKG